MELKLSSESFKYSMKGLTEAICKVTGSILLNSLALGDHRQTGGGGIVSCRSTARNVHSCRLQCHTVILVALNTRAGKYQ